MLERVEARSAEAVGRPAVRKAIGDVGVWEVAVDDLLHRQLWG